MSSRVSCTSDPSSMVVKKVCPIARRGTVCVFVPCSASQFQKPVLFCRSAGTVTRAARSLGAAMPGRREKCGVVNASGSPSVFSNYGRSAGQMNRPRSRRLAQSDMLKPSCQTILISEPLLARNTSRSAA